MIVGDRVRVAHECMNNPAGAIALVIEVYDRAALRLEGGGTGVGLLFPNGNYDGFSPRDLDLWGVSITAVDHVPALASYQFTSVGKLHADYLAGKFAEAFPHARN